MLHNKLFRLFAFVCLVGLFLGLNLNLNFKFTDLDAPVTLNIMLIVIGVTIILFSLKNQDPLLNIVLGAVSVTFLIIIADYYTNYVVGLYPITCYLASLSLWMGLAAMLVKNKEITNFFYFFIGIGLIAATFIPAVSYMFGEIADIWVWLMFPVLTVFVSIVLMAKQKLFQEHQILQNN